jgi:hypothetical protein
MVSVPPPNHQADAREGHLPFRSGPWAVECRSCQLIPSTGPEVSTDVYNKTTMIGEILAQTHQNASKVAVL